MAEKRKPKIIFAAGNPHGSRSRNIACLREVIHLFDGAEISCLMTATPINPALECVQRAKKEISIRMAAVSPDDVSQMIDALVFRVTTPSYGITISRISIPCYEELEELGRIAVSAREGALAEYLYEKYKTKPMSDAELKKTIAKDKKELRPQLFGTVSLTTEKAKPQAIARRIRLAKKIGLDGVFVPPKYVPRARKLGLKTAVAGIRHPDFPVENDYQIITCTPEEAAQAEADFYFVGSPIINAPDPIAASEFFIRTLLSQ